jgi:ABC-type multidrug transport system fused ATPase/permease subunit
MYADNVNRESGPIVLDDVSLIIEPGQKVVVTGRSGRLFPI